MTQQDKKTALNGELQILMGIGHIFVGLRKYATVLNLSLYKSVGHRRGA